MTGRGRERLRFGFEMPVRGQFAAPRAVARLASAGEDLEYGYLTFGDHIVLPKTTHAHYPYSSSGGFNVDVDQAWLEQLTLIAFVAGITSRIGLMTSVMVVPYRNALHTAKVLATIDVLSEGRLSIGCGVGWMREEFEALGSPPFEERSAVTDEYLRVFKECWTSPVPRFDGRYVNFNDIVFAPKPRQSPLPLWIGGESGPAMRRAARLGDGWCPIGANPAAPLDTLERYRTAVEGLQQHARDAGRDVAEIALGYRVLAHGKDVAQTVDGQRRLFSGTPDDMAQDIVSLRDLGVSQIDFRLTAPTLDEWVGNLERFRTAVLDRVPVPAS